MAAMAALAQAPNPAEIRRKVQAGEQITPEERQLLQRANKQQSDKRRADWLKDHTPQSSFGLTALPDLGTGTYKGEQGGLYLGGSNTAPPDHLLAGVKLARSIEPLDVDGRKAPGGKIVLLSVGFSNPNMEFPVFQKHAAQDPGINPHLVTINGCVGGQASNVIADPKSNYWKIVDQRLSEAGLTVKQVQTLWIKLVFPGPSQPFPIESKKLYTDLIGVLHTVHDRFPNLKTAYILNRTYGGFTETGGSPEPWAYEMGFSVKWGPYSWTDGVKGRKDGMVFLREDLADDGLHPSVKGQEKVAELMMHFFKTDAAAKPWFVTP